MCYSADRPGDRHGRRRRGRRGRRPGGGVRDVRAQHRPAQGPARRRHRPTCPSPDGCACATWADGLDLPYEIPAVPVKVLLTGSAGFIGGGDRRAARGARRRGRPGRPAAPPGARRRRRHRRGTHLLDVRDAAGAAAAARRRRRGLPPGGAGRAPGSRWPTCPSYASHNDLGTAALLAAMHEAGVDRLVLASSMVVYGEGRYACAEHGDQAPPPRSVDGARGRRLREPLPAPAAVRSAGRWSTRTPGSTRAAATPPARSRQEHYARRLGAPGAGAAVALRYHNVYGPGMPRDTPYSGVAAMFRSSLERGEPPQVFEDGGQMRDFVHVARRRAGQRARAGARWSRRRTGRFTAYNVAPGEPVPILDVAELVAAGGRRAPDGPGPRSPAATGSATSGTSSPRRSGPATGSASPRRSVPSRVSRSSPPRRCGEARGRPAGR